MTDYPARILSVERLLRSQPGDHFSDTGQRLDIKAVLSAAPRQAVFYVCGPNGLIDAVNATACKIGIDLARIRFERFAATSRQGDRSIEVELRRSNKVITVAANQSVLDALRSAGINASSDCRVGNCGTCAVKVLEGMPEHRDSVLTATERERAGLMCICVSRAHTDRLVLDL